MAVTAAGGPSARPPLCPGRPDGWAAPSLELPARPGSFAPRVRSPADLKFGP